MRIALDAMGGDHAPEQVVLGALAAVTEGVVKPGQVLLVGDPDRLRVLIEKGGHACDVVPLDEALAGKICASDADRFPVIPASQVVGMDESPAMALRQKPESSLALATLLVRRGLARVMVSAGNTGASVAAAVMGLKKLPGVHRPGIAVVIEGEAGPFAVVDVGANVSPKPMHLLHYGLMGSVLLRKAHQKENPKVALLNIGGEAGKGNELAKEVQSLFKESSLNFIGNIEGQDVFLGKSDVIVTEGFVGNVVLKLSEGLATHLLHVAAEELAHAGVAQEQIQKSLGRIVQRTDYSEYGGALLLGTEGIVTICHGRSEARAFRNAIRLSVDAIQCGINDTIVEEIRGLPAVTA